MLKKMLALATASLFTMAAAAYSVTGTVTDSASEPEAFATVRVYQSTDSIKPVSMGITDENGLFSQNLDRQGDYRLVISSVGKSSINRPFQVNSVAPDFDFGVLVMSDNAEILSEVEVVATKPLVVKEIDRIGYDVQADEDSKTSNVQDMLRKVPMVTVDADGTIKVKGSGNFKIYKDGRPNNSFTSNAKDIFAAIPASMIERIEVITDPGAKEDAEGVGAILNIVTVKHSSLNGFMGNVRAGMISNNDRPVGGLWLSGNVGKFVFSANAGYFHQDEKMNRNSSDSETEYIETGNTEKSNSETRSHGDFVFFGLDSSFELDSLNLFTLEFSGHSYDFKNRSNSSTFGYDPAGNLLYSFSTLTNSPKGKGTEFNGNFNYQHSTRRKGESLTFSYQISNSTGNSESNSHYEDLVNFPADYNNQSAIGHTNFLENTLQLDWTRPINEHHTISVGGKFISRNNHSKNTTDFDLIDGSHKPDYVDFSHLTTIGAGYFDYRLVYGKVAARAGLRYEYSRLSAKYKDKPEDNFGSSLNDFVPQASVMYSLSETSSIKAAYSSRINRPGINYLNPNVTYTPTSQSSGNPDLSSSLYNSLMLNYSLFTRKFNVDLSASYDFTNNAIEQVTWANADDYVYSTYENVAHTKQFQFSAFAQWAITQKTNVMLNGSVNYDHVNFTSQGLTNHLWSASVFFRATQQLPWKLRLEGMMFYRSGDLNSVYGYSNRGARTIFHGFSLQRSFLKGDALTVKIHARNPFNNHYAETSYVNRGSFKSTSHEYMDGMRMIGLELSFRFGTMKAQVKKTATSISNDDLQGGAQAPSTGETSM